MDEKNGSARKLVRPGASKNTTRPVNSGESSKTETKKNGSSSSIPKELMEKFPPDKTPPVSASKPGRLPSLRGERDLTLGGSSRPGASQSDGATKMSKFAPNVKRGTLRRTNTQEATVVEEKADGPGPNRGRGRDSTRGRGRGRGRPELIQTAGAIFGDGIADLTKHSSGGSSSYREKESSNSATAMERPRLDAKASKLNKEEEDATLTALMRDDFVDYGFGDEGDMVMLPVQLPKSCLDNPSKEEVKESIKPGSTTAAVNVKQEKLDGDDQKKATSSSSKDYERRLKPAQVPAEDLFRQDGDIVFIQLPDVLPSLKPEKERPVVKAEPGAAQDKAQEEVLPGSETSLLSGSQSAFDDIPEGRIGTLRIHQSGKLSLQMGDHLFIMDSATQVSYLQDLISVDVNDEERQGKMTALGPIKYKGVCLPDWEQLIEDL